MYGVTAHQGVKGDESGTLLTLLLTPFTPTLDREANPWFLGAVFIESLAPLINYFPINQRNNRKGLCCTTSTSTSTSTAVKHCRIYHRSEIRNSTS